uniref:Uncharacterized protein n=1 Tax=Babesia bovis TaxID=5865 RepID=S6B620_BABBO|nr:hypothetical protein [Babesia bovis]
MYLIFHTPSPDICPTAWRAASSVLLISWLFSKINVYLTSSLSAPSMSSLVNSVLSNSSNLSLDKCTGTVKVAPSTVSFTSRNCTITCTVYRGSGISIQCNLLIQPCGTVHKPFDTLSLYIHYLGIRRHCVMRFHRSAVIGIHRDTYKILHSATAMVKS